MTKLFYFLLFFLSSLSVFAEEVDVALIFAVDVSGSISTESYNLQKEGTISALLSDDIIKTIEKGIIGKIALKYMEWAGKEEQISTKWYIIENKNDMIVFINSFNSHRLNESRGSTSISGALMYANNEFANTSFKAVKKIIDISGDGSDNDISGNSVSWSFKVRDIGISMVEKARDIVINNGITINGLPILTEEKDLDKYFINHVIGGNGSFLIPSSDYKDYENAIKRKILMEIG